MESRWPYVRQLTPRPADSTIGTVLSIFSLPPTDRVRAPRPRELTETLFPNSYNRYLAVAARVVRRSLKEDKRIAAERRGEMDLRFAKWQVRRPPGDAEPTGHGKLTG